MLRAIGQGGVLRECSERKLRLPMTHMATPSNAEMETLWREMHRPLIAFVARRVRDPRDAEDVVQDVMLRVHRHADDIAQIEHVSAWVHRIAHSAIVDFYRRQGARRELPVDLPAERDGAAVLAAGEEPSESAGLRSELAPCVAPLLARLPDKYREALKLTEIDGLSQVEAARQLGLSSSGMKARVQRARGHLRQLLLECCHVELDRRGGITDYEPRPGGCGPCHRRTAS
jgi:RNA polymerase sigma-70 factor (ECF subfamily)